MREEGEGDEQAIQSNALNDSVKTNQNRRHWINVIEQFYSSTQIVCRLSQKGGEKLQKLLVQGLWFHREADSL